MEGSRKALCHILQVLDRHQDGVLAERHFALLFEGCLEQRVKRILANNHLHSSFGDGSVAHQHHVVRLPCPLQKVFVPVVSSIDEEADGITLSLDDLAGWVS